jgi:hypothetical protein
MSRPTDLTLPGLLIAGNPVDGFEFYGPFEDPMEAGDWAQAGLNGRDWWVANVAPPHSEPASGVLLPEALVLRIAEVLTTPGAASARETRDLIAALRGAVRDGD